MSRGGGGRPIPGKVYVRSDDGDLEQVASEAYGDSGKSKILHWSNPAYGTTGKPRVGTGIKAGEMLIIPGTPPPLTLTGKQPDDLTVMIDGLIVPMQSAKILRTMDTGCDGWTGRIAWTPGENPRLDKATKPYGYPRAAAYIGNELMVGGCLYIVEPEMTDQGLSKGLHGFSFTADAIDSKLKPPYEYNGVSLKQLADALLPPLGIKAVFTTDPGGAFKRVTANEGDSIFAFLSKLAAQRGILVSCTPAGDMLFCRADTTSKPVGVLTEGQPFVVGWKAVYDGRKRYHAYRCITKGSGKSGPTDNLKWDANYGKQPGGGKVGPSTIISFDTDVPRSRWTTFHADDTTPGNIHDAARWKRNRTFVDALTQEFPVSGWYAPDGSLWRVNTRVTVISPTLGVPDGYTFTIRAVEYEYSDRGRTATLSLVPPEAYTNMDVGVIWK